MNMKQISEVTSQNYFKHDDSSLQRILDNYVSLRKVWKHCLDDDKIKSELTGRIIGVKVRMQQFDLSLSLNLFTPLYSHTDNLAKSIQIKRMSPTRSKRLADLTIQVPENLRNEKYFNSFYLNVLYKVASFCK